MAPTTTVAVYYGTMAPTTPITPHPPELKMSAVVRGSLILIITAANLLGLYSAFLACRAIFFRSSLLHMLTVLKNMGVQYYNLSPSLPYLTMFCSCGMMSVPVCCMAGVAGAGDATGANIASGARLEMDGVVPVVSRLWGVEPSMFWGVCPVESKFGVCPVDSMFGVCPVDSMF